VRSSGLEAYDYDVVTKDIIIRTLIDHKTKSINVTILVSDVRNLDILALG